MDTKNLFALALGLVKPWKCEGAEFSGTPKKLTLKIVCEKGIPLGCPKCGAACPIYDTVERTWRHMNFFQYECELVSQVPRIECPKDKVLQVEVPWAREGSGFTLMFEAIAMALCESMPVKESAEILQEHDTRLWRVIGHYVEDAQAKKSWVGVKRILVDETSSRKGHKYVTNFVDAENRDLLFMTEGRNHESFKDFAQALKEHQGKIEQIELIGMDMSPAFIKGAQTYFPTARIVFDHFHIMQMAGKAVDEVRKQLKKEGADMSEGMWALRGNEETRTEAQLKRRFELIQQYPKMGRAMALREYLQESLREEDPQSLKDWLKWAQRSRLKPFQELARTVKEHWDGIVAFIETRVTNGVIEAINGLLQLAKRLARGFRSFRNFQTMGYLKAGKLILETPHFLPT